MTRHVRIQMAIVVAISFLILAPITPTSATASEPAVDQANFRWAIGYSFEDKEGAFGGFFPFSIGLAETETHTLSTAGIFVVPLTASSGARVHLIASGARREADFSPIVFQNDTTWAWGVGTGADLFLRDPEIGHFDVGYSFVYQELVETGNLDTETHSFNTSAGLFTDGFGIVPVDLELAFSYSRIGPESFFLDNYDAYSLAGLLRFYPHTRLRLDVGATWLLSDPTGFDDREDLRALGEILWLPPFSRDADRNHITFSAFFTAGQVSSDFGLADDLEQDVYSVGFGLTVLFTPVESLIQFTRQRS